MKKIIFAILSIVVIITTFCMSVFGATQNWQTFTFTTDGQTIDDEREIESISTIQGVFLVDNTYQINLHFMEDPDTGWYCFGAFGESATVDLRGMTIRVDVDTLSESTYQFMQTIGTFAPIDQETPTEPIGGLFGTCYNLLAHHIFDDVVDTPAVELTLTLASTVCSFAVIAIPFILIYKVIRLMG